MPELLTSVDDLFSSAEFGFQLMDWQVARMDAIKSEGNLASLFADRLEGDSSLSPDEISHQVLWMLELSPDEFEEWYYDDSEALALYQQRFSANEAEDVAKQELLVISESQGVSQFALYGLWLHLRGSGVISAPKLMEKVVAAENDFNAVDEMIRAHPGELLTVIDFHVQAGRLGEGGIIINDNHSVLFPQQPRATNYGASLSLDMPKIHSSDRQMSVNACGIHSILKPHEARIIEDWSELLNQGSWHRVDEGSLFVIGDVVEGPPFIHSDRDRDYYEMVFDRIRTVGALAADGSIS